MTGAPTAVRLPASVLTDPQWLAERFEQLARGWLLPQGRDRSRGAGTLWWSMSVYVLLGDVVDAVAADRAVPNPELDAVGLGLEGAIAAVSRRPGRPGDLAQSCRELMRSVIEPASRVSGAGERSLWAVAADALANRALDPYGRLHSLTGVLAFADAIGPILPRPRVVTVRDRAFVRRNSCCLYYLTPLSDGPCSTCPHRHPRDRLAAISAAVPGSRA
jgi:hypothetical protein